MTKVPKYPVAAESDKSEQERRIDHAMAEREHEHRRQEFHDEFKAGVALARAYSRMRRGLTRRQAQRRLAIRGP